MSSAQREDLRRKTVALRRKGWSYGEIQEVLGVPKGTLSVWLRDVPLADEHREALDRRKREAAKRGRLTIKARRREKDRHLARQAASQVGGLTRSELFIAGVVAYWAEGTKSKPWRRNLVRFINSDPGMILLFLAWLDLLGISRELVAFRLAITSPRTWMMVCAFGLMWSGFLSRTSNGRR